MFILIRTFGDIQMTEGCIRRGGMQPCGLVTAKSGRDAPAAIWPAVRDYAMHHLRSLNSVPACSICEPRIWEKMLHAYCMEVAAAWHMRKASHPCATCLSCSLCCLRRGFFA